MTDWFFNAPGNLNDFSVPTQWHEVMSEEAKGIVKELVAQVLEKDPGSVTDDELLTYEPKLSYVNPITSAPPQDAETVPIQAWRGFPRAVRRRGPWEEFPPRDDDADGSFRAVEHLGGEDFGAGTFIDRFDCVLHLPVRDRQDEYLEWAIQRNRDQKITKVTFVAEGYDYFSALFKHDESRVLDIYKKFTGLDNLKVDDLRATNGIRRRYSDGQIQEVVEPGHFNPRNRYNINPGIVHLSHRANSLSAEVNLAGVSGLARENAKGELLSGGNAEELLCCNAGGNPNRNSDPLISLQAYAQVLQNYRYTLANPVGLYIAGIDHEQLFLPNGEETAPREWWHVTRGEGLWSSETSRVLRVELEIPKQEKLTISDLKIAGNNVKYAGQLAELFSVHLFVTRWKRSGPSQGPVKCKGTCCRKTGTNHLRYKDKGVPCPVGYHLAFPDLLQTDDKEIDEMLVVELSSAKYLAKAYSFR